MLKGTCRKLKLVISFLETTMRTGDQNKILILVSDKENAIMCKKNLYFNNAESTKAGLKIVKLMRKIKELENK